MNTIKKLTVRLDEKQYSHLKEQSQITGQKFEPIIRSLIMGLDIKPKPPDELAKILRELSAIGRNVNQIAVIANSEKTINHAQINEAVVLINRAWEYVRRAL